MLNCGSGKNRGTEKTVDIAMRNGPVPISKSTTLGDSLKNKWENCWEDGRCGVVDNWWEDGMGGVVDNWWEDPCSNQLSLLTLNGASAYPCVLSISTVDGLIFIENC